MASGTTITSMMAMVIPPFKRSFQRTPPMKTTMYQMAEQSCVI